MSVLFPSNQQHFILGRSQAVEDINYYWSSDDRKTFPTQYAALLGVNEKASQILHNFVNQDPPPSGIVWRSLQNLTFSYRHCLPLLQRMNKSEVEEANDQQFYSLEYIVTGLNPERVDNVTNPDLPSQCTTIPSNVTTFDSQVKKTAQFKKAFEDIVKLSRWPGYRDVVVESTIAGEFTVKRRALYQTIEVVALSNLALLGIVFLAYKVTRAYFSIPVEPT